MARLWAWVAGWLEKWQPGAKGWRRSGDSPRPQPECASKATRVDGSVIQRNTRASGETLRNTNAGGGGAGGGRTEPCRGVGRDQENQREGHTGRKGFRKEWSRLSNTGERLGKARTHEYHGFSNTEGRVTFVGQSGEGWGSLWSRHFLYKAPL